MWALPFGMMSSAAVIGVPPHYPAPEYAGYLFLQICIRPIHSELRGMEQHGLIYQLLL